MSASIFRPSGRKPPAASRKRASRGSQWRRVKSSWRIPTKPSLLLTQTASSSMAKNLPAKMPSNRPDETDNSRPPKSAAGSPPLKLFLVAGEHSGDALGGKLIEALRDVSPRPLTLQGVSGPLMQAEGCPSLFPLAEIAVMGPLDILPALPA